MIRLTQHEADQATAICDGMLATIAKMQADFAALKVAADAFQAQFAAEILESRSSPNDKPGEKS
jgi:hypothetical protein